MLAVNYSTIRNKLKTYCDEATDNNETIIVTRKEKNAEYLAMLNRSLNQLETGKGQKHELIEVDDI